MKVWVLSDGGWSGGEVYGVYSTLQAAEAARDRYQSDQEYRCYRKPVCIDECEVDVDRWEAE